MKLSKIYKDKKKGVHVCYSGKHYGAPEGSAMDADKRAELGPVSAGEDGKDVLAVKQGDTTESWPLIGAYTKGGEKEKPAAKEKKAEDEPAPKSQRAKGAAAPAPATAKKGGDKKKAPPRKRSQVAWKEPTGEQQEAVVERIREAGGDEALPTLKAAWTNWLSDRKLPLFQGFSFGSDELNERVQTLGQELMKEFGAANSQIIGGEEKPS